MLAESRYNFNSISVTVPSEADAAALAYFARTQGSELLAFTRQGLFTTAAGWQGEWLPEQMRDSERGVGYTFWNTNFIYAL
jgi:hypothetical protein